MMNKNIIDISQDLYLANRIPTCNTKEVLLEIEENIELAMCVNNYENVAYNLLAKIDNELLLNSIQPKAITIFMGKTLKECLWNQVKKIFINYEKKIKSSVLLKEVDDTLSIKAKVITDEKLDKITSFNSVVVGLCKSGLNEKTKKYAKKIFIEHLKKRPNDVLWQSEKQIYTLCDALTQQSLFLRHDIGEDVIEQYKIKSAKKIVLPTNQNKFSQIINFLLQNNLISADEVKEQLDYGIETVISLPQDNLAKFTKTMSSKKIITMLL